VEAYLVGLNTELSRELLWRAYPPTGTATFFRRFWDNGVAPAGPPDIDPIDGWGDRELADGADPDDPDRFVLLVRSDLLRRYPNAIIYAVRPSTTDPNGVATERYPLFTGALDPDVRYFGFDIPLADLPQWSLVIQEQPTAPRFGIDAGQAGPGHVAPPGADAAVTARALRRQPVRLTIPTSVLLGGG